MDPGSCNGAGARALRVDEEEGGLGVAGALRTNDEEEEGLDGVEEVGEGDGAADEGEDGVEGWGEREGRRDAHLQAEPTCQMVHLIVCVQLSTSRVKDNRQN
ncbi:hypothetical protein C2845_PM02G12350 [Panicum miliaceum]|uniref:Uncharacterized protein n=1 Tax=Panicum miliaceum TaxID=4540 RepID=A0A3L6SBK3_PANMI|nr:hypothetical protein C2845_PM02G12350 [Panicum miliaceum]